MSKASTPPVNRSDRRKARTRAALIRAAQSLIAQGRINVPILEITQAADVGLEPGVKDRDAGALQELAYSIAPAKLFLRCPGGDEIHWTGKINTRSL